MRSCRGRIKARWQADFWIPKVRIIEWQHPWSFDETSEAILTLAATS
jgi:hypothetical protein